MSPTGTLLYVGKKQVSKRLGDDAPALNCWQYRIRGRCGEVEAPGASAGGRFWGEGWERGGGVLPQLQGPGTRGATGGRWCSARGGREVAGFETGFGGN